MPENSRLRIALQKSGRLSDDSLDPELFIN